MTVMSNRPVADDDRRALRVELAAAFRICARMNWHESVGNHFSAAVSADGRQFLMNPRWRHFGAIRASDLLLLDAETADVLEGRGTPDQSAWTVHGTIHRKRPDVRVVLHAHPPYATALSTLKDPSLKPLDNNTARFFGDLGIDLGFGGIADDASEGERLAEALGENSCLMMGNHGVTVTADRVALAFEKLYFFEKAARTQILAYSTGQALNILSDAVARNTAEGWKAYEGMADAHFAHLMAELDQTDPSYRD
ncbi:class II aldolase/adducin family protein [Fulvimarina sp. 2208YS6-2-32]|uniref:Class II aldolase/adducin family protein n=1 Tax=Fulvimarina uroteuthidis TaxID=3098149 RepID=A0ABU5I7V0_9HYPH|nr:class II aldolase/adducin family protein [Fulvimarina sp. 2208YS6-2-32]MDY8110301.1 class II aldolase/adducin family protein [Fulvimarina sp. 2208YS6-2-32]